jgi:D-alanyl-D-alanine endopeptidase (penicillin-binding protein 7)
VGLVPYNVSRVRRRTLARALSVLTTALALAAAAAPVHEGTAVAVVKKAVKKKPVARGHKKKGHVFLERHVAATRGGQPNVQALGALVLDETGHEVFTRNADKERPIASISKLAATLVVAEKNIELDGLSTIEKGDLDVARGGARSRLLTGMTLSNRDLLHAALMGSDNRAIPALGRAVKLTPPQLTAAMNAKVHELGLKNTRFSEPTGLSPNNVSTPRETIKMLRAAMAQPLLASIMERVEYDAHPVGKPSLRYLNTDHAAARGNIQVLAGKTGYNDVARYCLVVATKIDARPYYMAFLSNEGKLTRFGDVARVADWLASHKPPKGTTPTSAPVVAAAPPGSAPGASPIVTTPAVPPPSTVAAAPATPPLGPVTPDSVTVPAGLPPSPTASGTATP